jgi:hypothetical protein
MRPEKPNTAGFDLMEMIGWGHAVMELDQDVAFEALTVMLVHTHNPEHCAHPPLVLLT